MRETMRRSFGAGGVAVVAAGLGVVVAVGLAVAPVAAQEADEEDRRQRISVAFSGGGGWLGVEIVDMDEERAAEAGMARAYGVHVSGLVDDGPAAEAGIAEGDVIVRWNGDRVESVAQLQRLVGETPAGRVADLTILRDGAERDISVELGDRGDQFGLMVGRGGPRFLAPRVEVSRERAQAARERAAEVRERAVERAREVEERVRSGAMRTLLLGGRARLGVSTQSLGDQLAAYFGVEGGALVTAVAEDSPAAAGGLTAGDVIVGIGEADVDGPGELREALADAEAGEVSVRIVREGAERTLTVELEERDRAFRWGRGEDGVDWDFDFDFDLPEFQIRTLDAPVIDLPIFEPASLHHIGLRV